MLVETNTRTLVDLAKKTLQERSRSCKASGARPVLTVNSYIKVRL
jgi:hypothetical protein